METQQYKPEFPVSKIAEQFQNPVYPACELRSENGKEP